MGPMQSLRQRGSTEDGTIKQALQLLALAYIASRSEYTKGSARTAGNTHNRGKTRKNTPQMTYVRME